MYSIDAMTVHLRRILLNLVFYIAIWFWIGQVNFFMGWLSVSIPVFWVFVFFPVMTLEWEEGLILTAISGLFFESRYVEFRGMLIPLFVGLYLYLYHRKMQMHDTSYRPLLWLASLSHLILIVAMSAIVLIGGGHTLGYLTLRSLQDWLTGQLALFLLFPLLWFGFHLINGSTRPRNAYGDAV